MVQFELAVTCPHCESTSFKRDGKYKNIQKYKCKFCNKSFRDTSLTSIHWMHKKDKIGKYIEALKEGMSVRKAAKYVGISKNTSFAWRHKLLSSLAKKKKQTEQETKAGLSVIRLEYSDKGRRKEKEKCTKPTRSLLMVSDTAVWLTKIKENGRSVEVSKEINKCVKNSYVSALPDKLLKKALHCQENVKEIGNLKLQLQYREITQDYIETVFAWMKRFKGVASKYLQHYWEWHISIYNAQRSNLKDKEFANNLLSSRSIYDYRNISAQ